MICRECKHGRRITRREQACVYCLLYGMIIRENHECTRKGAALRDGDDDQREELRGETELYENSGGAA